MLSVDILENNGVEKDERNQRFFFCFFLFLSEPNGFLLFDVCIYSMGKLLCVDGSLY